MKTELSDEPPQPERNANGKFEYQIFAFPDDDTADKQSAVFECDNDDEARHVAAEYAAQWRVQSVELCRVRDRSGRTEVQIIGQIGVHTQEPKVINSHMWIPYHGPQRFDEVCHLCGVFSGAHHRQPDPPEAALPCPEPWPEDDLTDQEFATLEVEAEKQDRADGKGALYDHQARRK